MYTGYLDLNLTNIYNILLATHILHMPRALEICRSFLLHTQPLDPQPPPAILKPIASRKTIPATQTIHPPTYSNELKKSEDTPFKKVVNTSNRIEPSSIEPSTSQCQNTKHKEPEKQSKIKKKQDGVTQNQVIIDIACCDGPVRFHRVINKNYGYPHHNSPNEHTRNSRPEITRTINKAMNENMMMRDRITEDENNQQSTNNGDMFTCFYCNHTFKSQYCYQKHARRHLNPVSLEPKCVTSSVTTQVPENIKREVKPLDMNVQYYPCKTCGSKFPSYYFVHKHRKLCHAEEMADNENKNNEMLPAAVENLNSDSDSAIDVEAVSQKK